MFFSFHCYILTFFSDTRIGTADFYERAKVKGELYDNPDLDISKLQNHFGEASPTVYRNPSPSNSEFSRRFDEETEYSVIRNSNDNIAAF